MRLNDPLITSFEFGGKEYNIDLSFDVVLDVFDVLGDKTLREWEKTETALLLLLDEEIKGQEAINLWNFVYENFIEVKYEQPIEYDLKGNPLPPKPQEKKRIIDIEKDAQYIYASFRQAYGMNLFKEQGNLHWHEFQALLHALPSDTSMQKIIQIRLWEPQKGDSAEYKENMRKLQKIYALGEVEQDG